MTTKTNLSQPQYNSSSWDAPLNTNFGVINDALGNTESVSVASANVTLTAPQAQKLRIAVSGALTVNRTLLFPAGCTGSWIITNSTTGAYTLTVQNTSGVAAVIVSQGTSAIVYSDGTNCGFADDGAGMPVGSILEFAGTAAPNGYLACDGASYSTSAYSRLYAAIGTTWGSGSGTFKVPDLRGAFLRGSGAGLNPASRTVGSYEVDGFKSHTHTATQAAHTHTYDTWASGDGGYQSGNRANAATTGTTASAQPAITVANSGGTETVPKNFAVLYCIKY